MTIKEIEETLEEGLSLKAITQAYAEIANLKVRKIRTAVERNRLFFDDISKVYGTVKAYAIKKKVAVQKPKKRLYILITSNARFYGAINASLIDYFIGSTREVTDSDMVIIGKGGIDYFRATKVLPNMHEVILTADMPTNAELANLANICSSYNQVLVFHAQFKSLLKQTATSTDITAMSEYLREFAHKEEDPTFFIFEPELSKILQFFDSQILTLLLEQTFLETELSNAASRFISMDEAEGEANKFIKEYQTMKAYTKRNLINNAILESFATIKAVRREKS